LESYSVLDRKQIDEIHLATLNVLERTGVIVYDDEALKLLESAGCVVDEGNKLVKIPKKVIDATLERTPSRLVLGGRDQSHDLMVERGRVFTRPGSGYTKILDIETEECRNARVKDVELVARLVDALENISFCSTHVLPNDVGSSVADVHAVRVYLENTEKHLFFSPLTYRTFRAIVAMARVVRGGEDEFRKRPLVSFLAATSTPLKIAQDCAKQLIDCAEGKVPVMFDSSPMLGATGPVTLAGSLVLQNAEDLAMNAIVQLRSPNSPVIYGTRCAPIDMKTGAPSWGSVETALLSAAAVQIAHYYGMVADAHGPCTDAKTHDEQVGFEKSICGLLPALAGSEIISCAGSMESLIVSSPPQLVIDDEFYGMMFRILRGIRVDEEALATELIAQVGHGAGYLRYPHTLRNYEKEHYLPRLFDKRFRVPWETAGGMRIEELAKKKLQAILSKHEVRPLNSDVHKQLDDIVQHAQGADN
jgi:trimethylamine--corrinoid protein Co-methyltransferase